MTRTELYEVLADGEGSGIEFKRDDVRPEQLARECVAFLNFRGGKVLLGVEDDGAVTGLTRSNCEEWVMDTIFVRYIHPRVIPYYEEIQIENKRVAVISLEQGTSKPYVVRADDREDIYIRVGSTSRRASREQIMRLMQEGDAVFHMETMPVNGTSMEDVDQERLRGYYEKHFGEMPEGRDETLKLMRDLDLAKPSGKNGADVLSIAGLLLFGHRPTRKLPQAGLRLIVYGAEEVELNALKDEVIDGPIVSVSDEEGNTIKSGLFDLIMDQLQAQLSREKIHFDGITRIRNWKFPREVLREIIINAFAHRDWTKFNMNRIEIFTDRIEITSAGALPNTLTIEKVLAGVQYPRNPILVRVLRDIGEMEDRGMGLRRTVLPVLSEKGFPKPKFESTEENFRVIVYAKPKTGQGTPGKE